MVPYVYLASSVCSCFQGLISTLTQGGEGGLLFRLTVQSCCGEGGTLQTNITGVCGEYLQCLSHTGFAPAHGVCTFPVYTAQTLGCSAGNCLIWALVYMHVPGLSCSGSGSWVLYKGAHLVGRACILHPSQVRAAQVTRYLARLVS